MVWLGWIVTASIAKNANAIPASVAASPSMLSSRLNAFVIPTSQSERERPRDDWTWISCTSVPVASTMTAAAICSAELRERRQGVQVVDQAGDEEERDAAVDAGDLAGQRHCPDRRPRARGRR